MPEPSLPPLPADPDYCVISRRNDSLTRRRRWSVFANRFGSVAEVNDSWSISDVADSWRMPWTELS